MNKPTCSEETAMRQAGDTVAEYLHRAVEIIDGEFGDGYARCHSELVGAIVMAQTKDYECCSMADALHTIANSLTGLHSLRSIAATASWDQE